MQFSPVFSSPSTAGSGIFDDSLESYLAAIRGYALLTPKEEEALTRRYAQNQDKASADRLITSHLRLVVKIAMGYRRYGLPMADVVAEGNIGLIKAVQKFDPERGFRLATYAMWWIRASINEYVLNSWSLVKIGGVASQKRIFYNLRKLKARLGAYDENSLSDEHAEQIAQILDVRKEDVTAMNNRLSTRDSSLNVPLGEDGGVERVEFLIDEAPNQEERLQERQERLNARNMIHEAMKTLTEREQYVLTRRRLIDDPETLESLGLHYGLSRERIRQIETRALEKLETRLRTLAHQTPGTKPAPRFCGKASCGMSLAA